MSCRFESGVRRRRRGRHWTRMAQVCAFAGAVVACAQADIPAREARATADEFMGRYGIFPPISETVREYEGSHNDCLDLISDPKLVALTTATDEAAKGKMAYLNRIKDVLKDKRYYLVSYNFTTQPNGKSGIGWNYCLFVDARTGVLLASVPY